MRGVKPSALLLLIALLAASLISVPALSGEHPWDSDSRGGGSTSTTASSSSSGRDAMPDDWNPERTSSKVSSGGEVANGTRSWSPHSLFFRVTYIAAEKLYAKMYGVGTMSEKQVRTAGR